MQQRKDAIVSGFRKGLSGLLQANKIKVFAGTAIVSSPKAVLVENQTGQIEINAAKGIIIATGSIPVEIPAFPFDGKTIVSSAEALSLPVIPASMVIVGGGIVGCELACVYAAVGTKVTIVEALERIINAEDKWVSQLLEREFKKLSITVLANQKVTAVEKADGGAKIILQSGQTLEAEKVLVAVGRRAVCDKQTIDNLKLQTNGPAIKVNGRMETNVSGIYAIGDVVGTTYLAHGAFAEAEVVADNS